MRFQPVSDAASIDTGADHGLIAIGCDAACVVCAIAVCA